jgi:hypothetical protein
MKDKKYFKFILFMSIYSLLFSIIDRIYTDHDFSVKTVIFALIGVLVAIPFMVITLKIFERKK